MEHDIVLRLGIMADFLSAPGRIFDLRYPFTQQDMLQVESFFRQWQVDTAKVVQEYRDKWDADKLIDMKHRLLVNEWEVDGRTLQPSVPCKWGDLYDVASFFSVFATLKDTAAYEVSKEYLDLDKLNEQITAIIDREDSKPHSNDTTVSIVLGVRGECYTNKAFPLPLVPADMDIMIDWLRYWYEFDKRQIIQTYELSKRGEVDDDEGFKLTLDVVGWIVNGEWIQKRDLPIGFLPTGQTLAKIEIPNEEIEIVSELDYDLLNRLAAHVTGANKIIRIEAWPHIVMRFADDEGTYDLTYPFYKGQWDKIADKDLKFVDWFVNGKPSNSNAGKFFWSHLNSVHNRFTRLGNWTDWNKMNRQVDRLIRGSACV